MHKKMRTIGILLALSMISGLVMAASARRFALMIGANQGASSRAPLRYAVSDARQLAMVLQEVGGVQKEDCILLKEPDGEKVRAALRELGAQIVKARNGSIRSELVVYYSGHADEQGLMLGPDSFPYPELRQSIADLKADVKITIIDACSSGAITRLKGGTRHPAFLSDTAASMQGYAFLTSSSEDETAQESDRIMASFFTYYLISGLRGAADSSGDGKVTLNEVYQFAFNETLGHTVKSAGGAQHPAYDMKMAGTGDFVMTDVRGFSATLVLPASLAGRLYILNSERQLIAELQKVAGRPIELGLGAGDYLVYLESGSQLQAANVRLVNEQAVILEPKLLIAAKKEPSILRGPSVYSRQKSILAGRSRFELFFGSAPGNSEATAGLSEITSSTNSPRAGFAYSYSPREYLSLRLSFSTTVREKDNISYWIDPGMVSSVSRESNILFGVRYYPFRNLEGPLRPYVSAGFGPYFLSWNEALISSSTVMASNESAKTVGFQPGAGIDIFAGRHFAFSVFGAYNLHPRLETASGCKLPTGGFEVCGSFSLLLGRGHGR